MTQHPTLAPRTVFFMPDNGDATIQDTDNPDLSVSLSLTSESFVCNPGETETTFDMATILGVFEQGLVKSFTW